MSKAEEVSEEKKVDNDNDTNVDFKFNISPELTKKGDCLLLIDESRTWNHITLGSKQRQKILKVWDVDTSELYNKQYGTVFELKGKKLVKTDAKWTSHNEDTDITGKLNIK